MLTIRRMASVLFVLACPLANAAEPSLKYFRSDSGISASSALPEDVNAQNALRWRTALDSGHSTPVVSRERIFLTTFNPASQQLATVALDKNSGKIAWKQT